MFKTEPTGVFPWQLEQRTNWGLPVALEQRTNWGLAVAARTEAGAQ